MKILFFLSDNELTPTTISGKLFAKALAQSDYSVEIIQDLSKKRAVLAAPNCDIIFFQKTIYPGHGYNDIKHLKGKVKLIHIDDDFLGMDEPNHINTLEISDLILVGNQHHAELMPYFTSTPAEVIYGFSDYKNFPYISFEERINNPLVICWQQNMADVYIDDLLLVKDAMTQLHQKYQIRLQLYGWHKGQHPGYPDNRPLIQNMMPFAEFIPFQPYKEYLLNLVPQIAHSDIAIAPYVDIPDRYGKGGFGIKGTMLSGVPVVASNFGIYRDMITDGISGFLAGNSREWFNKIEKLILDDALRKKFSLASRHRMETVYGYQSCIEKLLQALGKHFSEFKK